MPFHISNNVRKSLGKKNKHTFYGNVSTFMSFSNHYFINNIKSYKKNVTQSFTITSIITK